MAYTHCVEWTEPVSVFGYNGSITKGFKTTADAIELHRAQLGRRQAEGDVLSFSIVALKGCK